MLHCSSQGIFVQRSNFDANFLRQIKNDQKDARSNFVYPGARL